MSKDEFLASVAWMRTQPLEGFVELLKAGEFHQKRSPSDQAKILVVNGLVAAYRTKVEDSSENTPSPTKVHEPSTSVKVEEGAAVAKINTPAIR